MALPAWLSTVNPVWLALIATCFTWGVTALGAAMVFLFKTVDRRVLDAMLGFAAGVMIAASFWSLLAPAIDMAKESGNSGWFQAAAGFLLGGLFVAAIDKVLPHLHLGLPKSQAEGIKTQWQRSILLVMAITLHNLPEGMEPGLKETAFYDPTNFTFPGGCYIAEVEVDPETGKTDVLRFVAADDFGNIINPMIVEGQVHGGLTQGIGQALLEGVVYDESGQLLTASYQDYCMPRADDVPSYEVSHQTTPCTTNPLGIKGCGEAGAIGSPPAVINAITHAIGNENVTMPATPMKVWKAANGK